MKIVAIVGSPRPNGNTNYLVDQALEEAAAQGIETEKIELSRYRVNPCQGHDNCASLSACKQDDDVTWILEKFRNADGIILGTPTYYYNMTAQMKAFVDRNFFLYMHGIPLKALCAGFIVVAGSAGADTAVRALRRCFAITGDKPDERIITVSGYARKIGAVKNNAAMVEEARNMGKRMAEIMLSVPKPKAA